MRIGLGFGLILGAGGASGSVSLTAPTLTWTSAETDATPEFLIDGSFQAADIIHLYRDAVEVTTHPVTQPEIDTGTISLALSAWSNGTYSVTATIERDGTETSPSNTETVTINVPVATTWNAADKGAAITLTNSDLTATWGTASDQLVRATDPYSGAVAKTFAVTIGALPGSGGTGSLLIGVSNTSQSVNSWVGNIASVGFQPTSGNWLHSGGTSVAAGVGTAGAGAVVEIEVNGTNARVRINGGAWSSALSLTGKISAPYYPAVSSKTGGAVTADFTGWA